MVPLLVGRGHDVVALARSPSAAQRVGDLGATPVLGDLDEPGSLPPAFGDAQGLINLASLGFGHARVIVDATQAGGIRRAVFVSTTAIFTNMNVASKAVREAAERTIRDSDLDWTIVRPTMVYGTPSDRNMARLLRLVARSPVVPMPGGGKRLQQPVHVDDLAVAIVAAFESPRAVGADYNVAGPSPLSLRRIVEEAGDAVGRRPRSVPIPLPVVAALVGLYQRLVKQPRLTTEQIRRLAEDKAFDISRAEEDLAYAPRSFATGIDHEAAQMGLKE